MARPIQVDITGNSASLERAFARSERAGSRFSTSMGRTSRATSGRFAALGGAALTMSSQFADSEDSATGLAQKLGAFDQTGVAASALVASTALTTMITKVTGLDKVMGRAGEKAFDLAAGLGLVSDPGKQFAGKAMPTQSSARFLRNQAFLLEQRGMTPAQAADRLAATHPNVAKRDLEVYAGVRGNPPTSLATTHVHVHLDGREVAHAVTRHQTRAGRRTANQTSGFRG